MFQRFPTDRIDYWSGLKLELSSLLSSLSLSGLSFVKLDSLAPSLRAITLDYFCLQSYTTAKDNRFLMQAEWVGQKKWRVRNRQKEIWKRSRGEKETKTNIIFYYRGRWREKYTICLIIEMLQIWTRYPHIWVYSCTRAKSKWRINDHCYTSRCKMIHPSI